MAIDLKAKNIPPYLKAIFIVVPAVILVVLFIVLIYSPKNKEIQVLGAGIIKLDNEIKSSEVKVRKLDELKAENAKLQMRLAELKEQLPEEGEVSILLKQISDLGLVSGLVILLWKPEARKPDPKGIYMEIPVRVAVVGGYHDLGVFYSHISQMRRIVNISNIKINPTKAKGEDVHLIDAGFTASTFSAVVGAETPKKKKKRKKRR